MKAVLLLWEGTYGHGERTSPEYCYLVKPEAESEQRQTVALGLDPEEAHLPSYHRLLQGVAWVPLAELMGDAQVARVLMALAEEREWIASLSSVQRDRAKAPWRGRRHKNLPFRALSWTRFTGSARLDANQ